MSNPGGAVCLWYRAEARPRGHVSPGATHIGSYVSIWTGADFHPNTEANGGNTNLPLVAGAAAAAIGRTRTLCAQSGSVFTARGGSRLEACLCSNEGRSTNLSCRGWNAPLHAAAEKECTPREQHHARGHGKDVGRCNTCCGLFDPRCRHLLI